MRRYWPCLALSLAIHGCLLLAFSLWKIAWKPQADSGTVILEFRSQSRQSPSRASEPLEPGSGGRRGMRFADAGELTLPEAGPRAAERARARTAVPAGELSPLGRAERPRLIRPGGRQAFPSAAEALKRAQAGAETPQPPETARAEESGYKQESALEWKGKQRRMLYSPNLSFPELLAEKGLEVDVVAAFAVAPNGQVTKVEITGTSGFASVDQSVVQALQNSLFSAGDAEDQGSISFHFRLERNP